MITRIISDILFLIIAFICPWWMTLFAGIILVFYFSSFYEILVAGLIVDSLYSMPLERFFHFQFVITAVCIILFLISYPIKSRLRV